MELVGTMKRNIHCPGNQSEEWPATTALAPLFLEPSSRETLWSSGNDSWALRVWGLKGTGNLPRYWQVGGHGLPSANEANLTFWDNPDHGILLYYKKFGNGLSVHRFWRGDTTRLKEWVRTTHDDLRPVGLYIPFEKAWPAVKDFMDSNGELPNSIAWIKSEDLPIGTFPDPWEHPEVK